LISILKPGKDPAQPTSFGPISLLDTIGKLFEKILLTTSVTLDKRLNWLTHIKQVRRRTAQRMVLLSPLLNRRSELSVRNGVLLYKQLIRPMMDYAYPAWRSATRTNVRRLQVLQSKCLRLVTGASWYLSNGQIHKELGVPLFADHIRPLIASFDSRLADVGNPLFRQLGRYLR
jgi:hypothetical protein